MFIIRAEERKNVCSFIFIDEMICQVFGYFSLNLSIPSQRFQYACRAEVVMVDVYGVHDGDEGWTIKKGGRVGGRWFLHPPCSTGRCKKAKQLGSLLLVSLLILHAGHEHGKERSGKEKPEKQSSQKKKEEYWEVE